MNKCAVNQKLNYRLQPKPSHKKSRLITKSKKEVISATKNLTQQKVHINSKKETALFRPQNVRTILVNSGIKTIKKKLIRAHRPENLGLQKRTTRPRPSKEHHFLNEVSLCVRTMDSTRYHVKAKYDTITDAS